MKFTILCELPPGPSAAKIIRFANDSLRSRGQYPESSRNFPQLRSSELLDKRPIQGKGHLSIAHRWKTRTLEIGYHLNR